MLVYVLYVHMVILFYFHCKNLSTKQACIDFFEHIKVGTDEAEAGIRVDTRQEN